MTPPSTDTLATDVAVLKNDVARMGEFFSRLDTAIEKISELSSSINSMLAVHDDRLERQDTTNVRVFNIIEENQRNIGSELLAVHNSVNNLKSSIDLRQSQFSTGVSDIVKNDTADLRRTVKQLERYKWSVIGGWAVIVVMGGLMFKIVPILIDYYAATHGATIIK